MKENQDKSCEKKELLLQSAKKEFLKWGFEKASLRTICKEVDMTTGALYFFFKNKADLFDCLVRDTALEVQELIDRKFSAPGVFTDRAMEKHTAPDEEIMQFLYRHRDEILLLCRKAEGTKYEGFRYRIELQMAEAMCAASLQSYHVEANRKAAIILARGIVHLYMMLVDTPQVTYEEVAEMGSYVSRFTRAGLEEMRRRLYEKSLLND